MTWSENLHNGMIARWFDGCFCHSNELSTEPMSFKRRRALKESTGEKHCIWAGKRLVWLAHGYYIVLSDKMKACTCKDLTAKLVNATPEIAAQALEIIDDVKGRWSTMYAASFCAMFYISQLRLRFITWDCLSLQACLHSISFVPTSGEGLHPAARLYFQFLSLGQS